MIKAIIFDFFGVVRQDAFHAWMRNHGYTRDDAPGQVSRRMDTGQISLAEFYKELAEISGQTLEEIHAEFAANEKFNVDVIAYIRSIKNKYKPGLLSNSEGAYLRSQLKRGELEGLFDVVLASADVGYAKPDKEFFQLMLEKLAVKPTEAVFVDDQQKNIDAAAGSVGMKTILFEDTEQFIRGLEKILSQKS